MDPYRLPDELADETIAALVERLESRGADRRFLGFIDDYLDQVAEKLERGVLLDLGCGSGVVTRRLAERAGSAARVMGADIGEKFLEAARSRSCGLGIEWVKTEPERLPFPDGSVDLVVMHTLLSHVGDPRGLLAEARRILADDGRLVVFDADHAATSYGFPDFETGRRYDLALIGSVVSQIDICRQLPRYLGAAGFALQGHRSYLLSEAGKGDFWLSSVKSWAKLIPAMGILPKDEGERWVSSMLASQEAGEFFACGSFYWFLSGKR